MKITQNPIVFLISSLLLINYLLTGCLTYGDNTQTQYVRIHKDTCIERSSNFYIFFEGEPLDFTYQKLGVVEAEGEEYASNNKILDHLKYQSWVQCANAVINVSDKFKVREKGTLFVPKSEEKYSSKVYKGLAVKINIDSTFIKKYGNGMDTSFVKNVRDDYKQENQKANNQVNMTIITIFVCVFVGIIALISKSEK